MSTEPNYDAYIYPASTQECVDALSKPYKKISYSKVLKKEGMSSIAEAFKASKSVNLLYFKGNRIDEEGFEKLADAVKDNTSLVKLMIYKNPMSVLSTKAIATSLLINTRLERLYLYGNKITDEGVMFIADALVANKTLSFLLLEKNQITDVGAEAIARGVRSNKTLMRLLLGENDLGDDWGEAVMEDDWREAMLGLLAQKEERYFSTEVGGILRTNKKESFAKAYFDRQIFTKGDASMLTRDDIRKMGASTIGEILSLKKLFGSPAHLSTEVGKVLTENSYKHHAMAFFEQKIHEVEVAVMLESEDFDELGILDPAEQRQLLALFSSSVVERSEEPGIR